MASKGILGKFLAVFAAFAALGVSAASAQSARAVGATPPRLSFVDGEVSYWRPGADDWVPAQVNTALAAGDSLYAASSGNFELEIESRAYVRAGSGTELGVDSLETGYLQLRVPSGHAAVDLRRLSSGQEIEVDTPNGAFLIEHTGYYRIDVDDQATRFSSRRGGIARVVPAGGEEFEVASAQQVVVSGTDNATVERVALAADDTWDRWNADRTAQLGEQPRSAQYVSADVAGVDDLDRYGDWRPTPKYGNVWVPRGVAADWAPYSDGRWVYDGYYGWTWVDYSPWGWAPYHYGRWCYVDNYWGWAPGPVVAAPVYSPALVAFFGGEGVGVSVSVGTPFVSWVALGWGEPVVPWWGPRGFVGRPYWGGWGGPRVVNNTVINNTTIVNVNNINRYDNFRARNAVIGVNSDRFGRGGRVEHVRIDPDRVRDLRPVRGELGVRPTRESLVVRGNGRGERPPDRIRDRQVVATRAPQDPSRMPRAAGVISNEGRQRPASRIVTPRMDRGNGREIGGDRNQRGTERNALGERRTPNEAPDIRGREVRGMDAGERGNQDRRGRGEVTRGSEPNPPGMNERNNRERTGSIERNDRNGTNEGRERVPTPPSTDRIRQQQRERGRGNDTIRAPSETGEARGRDRNETRGNEARVPSPSAGYDRHRNPGRDRNEIQAPRESAVDRGETRERGRQRIEQPRREAPPNAFDAARERGRQEAERSQRMQQRQMPAMEQPQRQERQQRQERPQRMESSRSSERQSSPRVEQQQAPRREAPRQEAPHVQRGGGGGGSPPAPPNARNQSGGHGKHDRNND